MNVDALSWHRLLSWAVSLTQVSHLSTRGAVIPREPVFLTWSLSVERDSARILSRPRWFSQRWWSHSLSVGTMWLASGDKNSLRKHNVQSYGFSLTWILRIRLSQTWFQMLVETRKWSNVRIGIRVLCASECPGPVSVVLCQFRRPDNSATLCWRMCISAFFLTVPLQSVSLCKTPLLPLFNMWTVHPQNTARTELHSMITFHLANTRGSRAAMLGSAHLCVPKLIVIHVSCLTPCRTWHWPPAQVLSQPFHLPLLSFRQSHQHTRSMVLDPYLPCDVPRQSGGSTQIPIITSYEPKVIETKVIETNVIESEAIEPEDLKPRKIELDRNLGTDPYQIKENFLRDNYQNPIAEDVEGFGKVGAEKSYVWTQMHSDYDSAESIADSDLEDGALRQMLTSPLFVQESTAPVKPAAMIQERRVSAKRTQADRRESLMWNSSHETRAPGKPAAMFSSGIKESGNLIKSSIFKNADPSNLGRYLLERNKDHLLSQARSELMKQEHQIGSLNNCIGKLQQ